MQIWVDADACPKVIKEILYRAAERTGVTMTLVANQPLAVPRLKNIRTLRVGSGFDVADNEIVRRLEAGELPVQRVQRDQLPQFADAEAETQQGAAPALARPLP